MTLGTSKSALQIIMQAGLEPAPFVDSDKITLPPNCGTSVNAKLSLHAEMECNYSCVRLYVYWCYCNEQIILIIIVK